MNYLRNLALSLAGVAMLGMLAPALASAQYFNNYCNGVYANYNGTCAPGVLEVYVQVLNQYNTTTRNPADFSVTVYGNNPSPASFPGSLSGTSVSVGGTYNVVALPFNGYTPSYSQGCTGTLANNEHASCIITESATNYYNSYPIPYSYYGYQQIPLTCQPSYQTVGLLQTITFNAQGGDYSQYNWQTPQRSYLNVGPTLSITFPQTGTQTVTVQNGTQTATCTVNVTPGVPGVTYPTYTPPSSTIYPSTPANIYVTPTYIPSLPNTGFEPLSSSNGGMALALAAAMLIASSLALLPYVRKAFAAVLG